MALFVPEGENDGQQIVSNLKAFAEAFNQNSDKPFFVEMSVGVHAFVCEGTIELADLLKKQTRYCTRKNVTDVRV